MIARSAVWRRYPWAFKDPRFRKGYKLHVLPEPPKPLEWRDPRVWTRDRAAMKTFDAPQWNAWELRARSEDLDEALQPFMDMPPSLKARRLDIPWWANPFGAWYLQNILALELLKLPQRTPLQKVANCEDDEALIRRQIAEKWRTLEFGDRSRGHPCSYTDYIQFLNEWFKGLDEEGRARLREHFDRKIRPLLAVMTHTDILWLEHRTQNQGTVPEAVAKSIAIKTTYGMPEFFDMSQRLRYEINEDYKIRDELGPELFALWAKAPERWPPERLARMYGLDFSVVRKLLVWHHFKGCYDACVEPDWTLPKRLFALEWLRDVKARERGKYYGKFRYAENKIAFYNDNLLFKDVMRRRDASYANVWEMDDPFRFLQTEEDMEAYWGDQYETYSRMFPEMIGKSGEPLQYQAQMPVWAGPRKVSQTKSDFNWMFAEIGVNVGHEALKKVELDPTNEKRRRFIIRQPDGTLRTAKMSEMRAWYWKEQWVDFKFWAPHMEWGIENSPSLEGHQLHRPDTPDEDITKFRRITSRPVKWFYDSHYTDAGRYDQIAPARFRSDTGNRPVVWPNVPQAGDDQRPTPPRARIVQVIPEM